MLRSGAAKTVTPKQEMIASFFNVMGWMTIIPALISFYGFYFFIFSRFLSKRKIAAAVGWGILITFVSGTIGFLGLNMLNNGLLFKYNGATEILLMVSFMSVLCMIHGIIALVIKGFINWYGDIKVKEELQRKNLETELALVKSQLNPHFLFNTINNIDVLIEKDASKASLYLNKLSDIMRFMLYETKTETVPLQQEITYISKYIDLQKIRTANKDFVHFTVSGNPGSLRIAPMLFVPFIENAFKHAANKKQDDAININIDITQQQVQFYCRNFFSKNPLNKTEPGGLGNVLIAKRLQLLYPAKHELQMTEEDETYIVNLVINLSTTDP